MKPRLLPLHLILSSLLVAFAAGAGPATAPATKPTVPATGPADVQRRVADLSRRAFKLLDQHQFDAAEPLLLQAVALDPLGYVNLYNLACITAVKGQADRALDFLERAAAAGYTDFTHLGVDPDLVSLRDLPRYKALVANKLAFQKMFADRALAALREQFGDGYVYEIDEPYRLIFATSGDRETLAALKRALLAQARSQWAQLFEHKPDEYIRVVVPAPADYRKLIRSPAVGGVYNDELKTLVARQLGQVMTHEFTHALHAADRAPLEQDHPVWLAEGLASLFEAAVWKGDVLTPQDNFRLRFLQNADRAAALIPLDNLLKMEQKAFVAKANLAYGQSSSLLLYLYEHNLLKPFYDTYKKGYDADPSGRAALEATTGKKLPDLEKAWAAWMRKRPLPPTDTGPDGPYLGVQLGGPGGTAVDGLKFSSVAPGGPAAKAGLKAGDVLVAVNGEFVPDFESYVTLMTQHTPGERVTLHVRRDGTYRDVAVTLARRP